MGSYRSTNLQKINFLAIIPQEFLKIFQQFTRDCKTDFFSEHLPMATCWNHV